MEEAGKRNSSFVKEALKRLKEETRLPFKPRGKKNRIWKKIKKKIKSS